MYFNIIERLCSYCCWSGATSSTRPHAQTSASSYTPRLTLVVLSACKQQAIKLYFPSAQTKKSVTIKSSVMPCVGTWKLTACSFGDDFWGITGQHRLELKERLKQWPRIKPVFCCSDFVPCGISLLSKSEAAKSNLEIALRTNCDGTTGVYSTKLNQPLCLRLSRRVAWRH